MENFSSLAAQLVREGGALQVADAKELEQTLRELLSRPQKRAALAAKGTRCLQAHRGATERTCARAAGVRIATTACGKLKPGKRRKRSEARVQKHCAGTIRSSLKNRRPRSPVEIYRGVDKRECRRAVQGFGQGTRNVALLRAQSGFCRIQGIGRHDGGIH